MKRIISLILAISLVLTLVPTFASAKTVSVTKTQTLTFGEGGITEYIQNNATSPRYTVTLNNGTIHMYMQTRAMISNNGSSYTAFIAFEFTAENSGSHEIKFMTNNPTETSADCAVYIVEKDACPHATAVNESTYNTITDGKTRPGYFLGKTTTATDPIGRFNFSKATSGVYDNVRNGDEVATKNLVAGKSYYLLVYCDAQSIINSPVSYKSGSQDRQDIYLTGVELSTTVEEEGEDEFEVPTSLNFNKETVLSAYNDDTALPAIDWTISETAGWTVDEELTRLAAFSAVKMYDNMIQLSLAGTSSTKAPWHSYSNANDNSSINARKTVLTVNTDIALEEGAYKIKFTGGKAPTGGRIFIYVDEQFAGVYDCYDAEVKSATIAPEVTLNTLNITPDSDGKVKVSFKLAEPVESDRTLAILSNLSFEKVDSVPTAEKIVINAPETLNVGETAAVSAYVEMSDGTKRLISGIKRNDAETRIHSPINDSDNYIKFEDSENFSIVGDFIRTYTVRNGVFTNPDGVATAKITANASGEAKIIVKAKVNGGEELVGEANITIPEVLPEIPGEEIADTKVNVYISALEGGKVETNLESEVAEVEIGTKVLAEAGADEGYTFAYWADSTGKVISENAKETFTINVNTSAIAVFEKIASESDTNASVYFYNGNGEKLATETVAKGTAFADVNKPTATLTGFEFDKWSIADSAVISTITRAVALFKDTDNTYTVKADGAVVASGKKYGEEVTVKATEDNFTCWKLGGKIVSYDKEFTFDVYADTELTKVCEGEAEAIPTVILDTVDGDHFLTYNVPAGFTKLEAGILFAESGNPTIGSFYAKATEKTGSGQFTAKPNKDESVARGYIIFRDASGSVRVIYAE